MTKDEILALIDNARTTLLAAADAVAAAVASLRTMIDERLTQIRTEVNLYDPTPVDDEPPSPPEPEPPPPPPAPGPTVNVASLKELQGALQSVAPGTVIVLAPGTYQGSITVPQRDVSTNPITVRGGGTTASDTIIRVPANTIGLAIGTQRGGFRFENFTIQLTVHQTAAAVVIGSHTETVANNQPWDITLYHVDILADPKLGSFRGILLHGRNVTIDGCNIVGFKSEFESQAIGCFNGPGPYTIRNSRLTASGECILFGGAASKIPQNATGILIENCVLEKTPDMLGTQVWGKGCLFKNLLELKRAENVTVRNCIFRNSYHGAQMGYAIVLTVRGEKGANSSFAAVRNVLIENCTLVNCGSGFNMLGHDYNSGYAGILEYVTIRNCQIEINRNLGGDARVFQLLTGPEHITIEGNTVTGDPKASFVFDSPPGEPPGTPGWVATYPTKWLTVTGNTLRGPVIGRGTNWSTAIQKFVQHLTWSGNTFVGVTPPAGFPPSV